MAQGSGVARSRLRKWLSQGSAPALETRTEAAEEAQCTADGGSWCCGPYPIHGPARLASKMEGKCEKKMRVDFRVLENPSQRKNGFALESPLTFIFIFKWGKPSKNKKPQ